MSKNFAPEMHNTTNILLVALTRFGDLLQSSPTIAGLKADYPNSRIVVLVDKSFATVCEGIPGIDEIYVMDLSYVCHSIDRERDGLVDAFDYMDKIVSDLKAKHFDLCLNISSSPYTSLLMSMLDVRDARGWASDDQGQRLISSPWAMIFAAYVYHNNRDLNSFNIVDTFRCLAGTKRHPRKLQYTVNEKDRSYVSDFLSQHSLAGRGPMIAIQVGASQEKRQWAPARFAELSRCLIEKLDARLIFTGTKSEEGIVNQVFDLYRSPNMLSIVGKTNISQLGAFLQESALLITGDTGTMHLGAAVGVPIVAVFLASAFCFETGPYSEGNIIVQPQIGCNPCNPNLPCARPDCHSQVNPELIAYLAELRLSVSANDLQHAFVPAHIASPGQVTVYVSCFDNDGFLDFRSLNGYCGKNGTPPRYHKTLRDSYRQLWKEEFNFTDTVLDAGSVSPKKTTIREGVDAIENTIGQAKSLLEKLCWLIQTPTEPPKRLSETNAQLQKIDKDIECLGLAHVALGPIIRLFVMETQNMRGNDPLQLASEMQTIYSTLERRVQRFEKLVAYYDGLPQ